MNVLVSSNRWLLAVTTCLFFFMIAFRAVSAERNSSQNSPQSPTTQPNTSHITPNWLEPVGLNLATLTGLLPESTLRDAVLVWVPGSGTVKYDSGVVNGNNIEVTVRYNLTNKDEVWCLGEAPQLDHTGTVQPSATMRIFSNGNDVTNRVQSSFNYVLGGLVQPTGSSLTYVSRYPVTTAPVNFSADGSIIVPANRGCKFTIDAPLPNLKAVFTMAKQDKISITQRYHHINTNIHSYIGVGAAGNLAPLQTQMREIYEDRHDQIVQWRNLTSEQKELIESSDYVFVKFPTSSHDMYGGTGDAYGTYRFAFNTSYYEWLSVDHVSAKLLPRLGHWRDADTQSNQQFLDYFHGMWNHGNNEFENFDAIKSAELILPPHMDYQPCMSAGNCSRDVLQEIYDHTYTAEVFFYNIERVRDSGLEEVPLLSVGNGFTGRTALADTQSQALHSMNYSIYLPVIQKPAIAIPVGCVGGCGWFDEEGQMLDFVAPETWVFP